MCMLPIHYSRRAYGDLTGSCSCLLARRAPHHQHGHSVWDAMATAATERGERLPWGTRGQASCLAGMGPQDTALVLLVTAGRACCSLLCVVPRGSWRHTCPKLSTCGLPILLCALGWLDLYLVRELLPGFSVQQKSGSSLTSRPWWRFPQAHAFGHFDDGTFGIPCSRGQSTQPRSGSEGIIPVWDVKYVIWVVIWEIHECHQCSLIKW